MRVKITAGQVEAFGDLSDSPTALEIAKVLPIEATASTWGEEIYFSIPVRAGLEDGASADVKVGDLAYWPPGHAFCIFFGPTPASYDKTPRAASEVNVVGRVTSDLRAFLKVRSGARVRIERVEEA